MDMDLDMDSDMDVDADTEVEKEAPDKKTLLMNHILLPRSLPREKYDSHETDLDLMNKMIDNVQKLTYYLPSKTVHLLEKLQEIYLNCTPQAVTQAINALGPDDTFVMFLKIENCAIMFHVPSNESVNNVQNVIIATIPGSLDASEIYENINNDIEVISLCFTFLLSISDYMSVFQKTYR